MEGQTQFWNQFMNENNTSNNRSMPVLNSDIEESLHQFREILPYWQSVCIVYERQDDEGSYIEACFSLTSHSIRRFIISRNYVFGYEEEREFHRLCCLKNTYVSQTAMRKLAVRYDCLLTETTKCYLKSPMLLALIYHQFRRDQEERFLKAGFPYIACNLKQMNERNVLASDLRGILDINFDILHSLNSNEGVSVLKEPEMRTLLQELYRKAPILFKFYRKAEKEKIRCWRMWNQWMVLYCSRLYGKILNSDDYKILLSLEKLNASSQEEYEIFCDYLENREKIRQLFPNVKLPVDLFLLDDDEIINNYIEKEQLLTKYALDVKQRKQFDRILQKRHTQYKQRIEAQDSSYEIKIIQDVMTLVGMSEKFHNCLILMFDKIYNEMEIIAVLYKTGKKKETVGMLEYVIKTEKEGTIELVQAKGKMNRPLPEDAVGFLRYYVKKKKIGTEICTDLEPY